MKVTTETVATREVKLTIEPDQETVRQSLRRTARRVSRHRPVPGYRPGHAPYGLVENIYGREALLYETLDDLGPRLYREAIEEADVEPFSQGQLEVESEDPLVLTAKVPLVPLVELGDYKELSIEPAQEVSVSEEQIQERLVQLQQENLEYASVERGAQMGDQVVASIIGTADGEVVVDQSDTDLDLNDDLTPPGFAEALLGAEANELREFSLSFPEDHDNEELAGRQIDFEVVVKSVREVITPEIDDELAKTVGDYENLAELKEAVAQELKQELKQEAEQNEFDAALEALIGVSKIEYPEAMIEREVEAALDNQRQRLQQMGFTFESYLRMSGETEEDWRERLRPDVEDRLVNQLVLNEFAESENIRLDEDEQMAQMDALKEELAQSYGDEADQVLKTLMQNGQLFSMYQNAFMNKAANHLRDMLTGRLEEEEASSDDAEEEEARGEETPVEDTAQDAEAVDSLTEESDTEQE